MSTPRRRALFTAALALSVTTTLTACGGDADADSAPAATSGTSKVKIAVATGDPYTETTIDVPVQSDIRSQLPQKILDSGELVIGVGSLPSGFPPLAFTGTDAKTITGAEPDLGRLVAATLGLTPKVSNVTWENLFVGIDSGRNDVGFSNITDTEERKAKYDFASYRKDELGWEVNKDSTWNFDGDYQNLAGLTVSVGAGTNQEKILLEWKKKLEAEGKKLEVKYYTDHNGSALALASGKIDAYFGPNPGIQYAIARGAAGSTPTRSAGTYSGAGESLQGLIAATSKKGSGLNEPVAAAINYLIENGQYDAWLKAYNLQNEAVEKSEINPPGLPLDNS
ncbi:transporter substrate-binding domain-containing protein [Kineosporia sp. NBRC 101731]|uniref:transporter substrate-binding domain-containing protein n=1 Tax=Kineosporia sp. NBRC 101731 TaxID=3032199 RepID=UPI0024A2F5A4|nr:transporter substrate-binding domain-containing protein [Kineosporia sp. NBRC 101731]GLY30066.1 putative amino acid ABC transporter, substrate-binding protein [Kineosporia sp. NBRC 101731]